MTAEAPGSVRLDRWLWAARCFKTRSLAARACAAGHVKVGGESARPAKPVRPGDRIVLQLEDNRRELEIVALSGVRGPAVEARKLYIDHTPPPPPREERMLAPERLRGTGRPTKQDRRALGRLRGY